MSTFSKLNGVPATTPVPLVARLGPFPCTKIRKLLTPRSVATPACGPSAYPSATGNTPPTFTLTDPDASPGQTAKAPGPSAELITVEGVPAVVDAAGAGDGPW